jgi:hypothetical protein
MTVAALAMAAGGVLAQPGGSGAKQPPPLSVWRLDAASAEHLQSGLACPAQLRSYRRIDLHVYDRFGLDVSCNYLDPAMSDVTVYLTRRTGATAADAMAQAKREFLQVRAAMHPQPISETQPALGGMDWRLALYSVDGGMRDGIWIADLDGWTLEYRVTYRGDGEARVMADIAAFITAATGSAGTHLSLCGKAAPPDRTGVAVTDQKQLSQQALMSAITSSAVLGAADAGKVPEHAQPTTWCVEHTLSSGDTDMMLWRGVTADGADAKVDRLTAMTTGEPPALMAVDNPLLDVIQSELHHRPQWEATIANADGTSVYGYFTDRPAPQAFAALYLAVLAGKAQPLSSVDPTGKHINIAVPPK